MKNFLNEIERCQLHYFYGLEKLSQVQLSHILTNNEVKFKETNTKQLFEKLKEECLVNHIYPHQEIEEMINLLKKTKYSFVSNLLLVFLASVVIVFNLRTLYLKIRFEEKLNSFLISNTDHPLNGLKKINDALNSYYDKNGYYPKNTSFDGIKSCWGKSIVDWIPNLVPEYLDELPHVDKESGTCSHQYLYRSDGSGYKLILNEANDCEEIVKKLPELSDQNRDCWAYGFWNENGKVF